MIDFIIKSTISLGVLYLFYMLFLRGIKTFAFNRYFLLGSLVFSLVIPFISIPIDNNVVPIMKTTGVTSITGTIEKTGTLIEATSDEGLISENLLLYIYATISLILLLRFGLNLFNIINTIISNQKERNQKHSMVLVNNQVLPHTFFNYIMVNKYDYNNDRIDGALIQHEITHCKQWHSIDIVFIETLKVLLWINPFVWLLKKPIQLNHEYLADNSVLSTHNINRYQHELVNIVLKSNSGLLISNFNFSLTKQRLNMMTKQLSPKRAIISKVTSIFMVFLLTLFIACNQDDISQNFNESDLSQSEALVETDKFDYLIGMEYTDKDGLKGLTRKTRLWKTYPNGEMIGRTNFISNRYKIIASERITKIEESNIKMYKIYDILVLNDDYKTCLGCLQSYSGKENILSIHPVSGVTKDTIHSAFKIHKETLRYQLVDHSNYEWKVKIREDFLIDKDKF